MVILKPQSKLHDPTFFYGGLRADSFKNFARHAGASYDFEIRTCTVLVSTQGGCWTCTTITTVSLRDDCREEKMK